MVVWAATQTENNKAEWETTEAISSAGCAYSGSESADTSEEAAPRRQPEASASWRGGGKHRSSTRPVDFFSAV